LSGKQTALLAGLLLIVFVTGWLLQRQDSGAERADAARQGPDLFIEDMDLKVTSATGVLHYQVTATKTYHYPEDDHFELEEPFMELIQPGSVWHIRSERGHISGGGETLHLLGRADIQRLAGPDTHPLRILTSDLLVKPEEETAETDNMATITSEGLRVEAVGLRADFGQDQLELRSRVRGRFDAAS